MVGGMVSAAILILIIFPTAYAVGGEGDFDKAGGA